MDNYPIRVKSPVEAIRTIRIEGQGIVRRDGGQVGYSGRYEKTQSVWQKAESLNRLAHIAAKTAGSILDYNDDEILVEFIVGSAGHDTIAVWIKRFQFGSCVRITGLPPV